MPFTTGQAKRRGNWRMLLRQDHVGPADAVDVPKPGGEGLVVDLHRPRSRREAQVGPPVNQSPAEVVVLVPVCREGLIEPPQADEERAGDGGVSRMPVVESEAVARCRHALGKLPPPLLDPLLQEGTTDALGKAHLSQDHALSGRAVFLEM